jgi:hypothetical protein
VKRKTIDRVVAATPVREGAGVLVHRTIGTPACRHLDPFLMLDHFGSDNPNEYIAGFPDHPHRGFITFTYMLDGHLLHQDSMGNRGDLQSGGAQWMKAASGIIHSEMPQQSSGLMRGFQLWINLPAREKMSEPAYQEFGPDAMPVVEVPGARVRVLSGRHDGARGPIEDAITDLEYFDVRLDPGARFAHDAAGARTTFLYVFEGGADAGAHALPTHALAILGPGDIVELTAGARGARLIYVAGRPIGEPIVQYGPFVMTNRAEIEETLRDYQHGRLVRSRATWRSA